MNDDESAWGALGAIGALIAAFCYFADVGGDYGMLWANPKTGGSGARRGYWTRELCEQAAFEASKSNMRAFCYSSAEMKALGIK